MLKNLITGEIFNNRKDAKKSLGHANFNRLFKEKKIIYINRSTLADCGEIHTNTSGN